MRYSSSDYRRAVEREQVKVAVLADSLRTEQSQAPDWLWAGVAIATALAVWGLVH